MILEEALQPKANCSIQMISKSGTIWNLSHIGYADDLCILAPTTQMAEELLKGLITTLRKYTTDVAESKTIWMHIKPEGDIPDQLSAAEMNFRKCEMIRHLGSEIQETGDSDEEIKANLLRTKKCLIRLRPLLRTTNLSIELFVDPIITHGLTTIVLRAPDNKRLMAMQNTARRMILGLRSRKEMKVETMKAKVEMKNLDSRIQQ